MQRLNLKLVLWLVVASLIAVVAVFFVHGFQMSRTARVLLQQAQDATDEENLEAAIGHYNQYIFYKPEDYDAGAKRALLMAELAERDEESRRKYASEALGLLEGALRNDPTRDDIRRKLVDFAVLAGRPNDSIVHIQDLLKRTPDDPELLSKLGACLARTGRDVEGAEKLREAIEKGGNQIDAYMELAVMLRNRQQKEAEADAEIEKMVEANRDSAKAYLQRSQWLRMTQRPGTETETKRVVDQIKADVQKAFELEPENADCIYAAGQIAASDGDLPKVKELMNKGHELHPKDERMMQMLVEVAIKENKPDEVDRLVKEMPDSSSLKLLLFEVKIQALEKEQARAILDELDEGKTLDPRSIEYMRARMMAVDGKWLEASREFERLRSILPGQQLRLDMLLGHCYEVLRQSDKQLEVYKNAVGAAPNSLEAHIGLARAQMAVGQNAEALKQFEGLKKVMGTDKFVKLIVPRNALLNLLLEQISRVPEEQRNWAEIDELMTAAKKEFPDASDLAMLDAKILEEKGNVDDARQMLEQSLTKDKKNVTAWLSLTSLAYNKDGAEAALKVIDEAQAAIGDSYQLRAMRVSCAGQLPAEEAKKLLADALKGIDDEKLFTPAQQKELRQLVGANYFRLREFGEARKIWQAVAKAAPDDQQALLVLFDISINEQDDAKVVEAITAIKHLLGADSPEARYVEVRRNLALLKAKKIEDTGTVLKEGRQNIRKAAEQRPRWNALPRVEAEIDMYENRPDEAIANLRKSIEFGATDYTAVRQLAELLTMRGRLPEAQQVLADAQSRSPSKDASAASDMLDVSMALSDNDVAKAIILLERALEQDPNDVRKIVWLGQIKGKAARYDEAEALFRQAIEKDPDFPTTWQELVKLLRDQRRESDAREVVNLALEKISKNQSEVVAAQCCELLGDIEGAEQHLKKARDELPNDLGLTRALALFYGRQKQFDKTRAELDRMLATKSTSPADKEQIAWANRELAVMIAGRGNFSDMNIALKRLNEKDPDDKATMAALLAGRPEAESRLKAVRLLEEVRGSTPLSADSRLVLAQLYDATGDWNKCKAEVTSLVASYQEEPRYLAAFVEMLIEHDELQNAEIWLGKLEALAPAAPVTSAVKAKLLVKQNKPEEAVSVLKELLPRPLPKEMLPTLLQVAQLLESLKLNDAAEPMYRQYKELNPRGAIDLAGYLGRHGSLKDALDMCDAASENVPKENVLRAALQILRENQGSVPTEDYARVEKWINSASAKEPKSMLLKLIHAELLDLQQRYPELEETYKRLLANPDMVGQTRAIVLNNLAFLLAVQNRPGESQQWIDEAIQIFGPTSDLLDTRALVEIANKDSKRAITDLSMAVVDQPTAVKYFHLAQAHRLNKDKQAATEAMKKALETYKLNRNQLSPTEQPKFDALMTELGLTQ